MIYALLIYSKESEQNPIDPGADSAALVQHRALQAETSQAGKLLSVARLDDAGSAKTVRLHANRHTVTDGPYMETKEWLVGLYMIECDDQTQALEHAKRLVTADMWCIEVRPVGWQRHE